MQMVAFYFRVYTGVTNAVPPGARRNKVTSRTPVSEARYEPESGDPEAQKLHIAQGNRPHVTQTQISNNTDLK